MEEETLTLQSLQRPDANIPQRNPLELISPANELDDVIGNTSVEDSVRNTEGALLDGSISQRIQRLEDKKNKYNLLNRQYAGAEGRIIEETQGRGITQLGRRSRLISEQNRLDSQRRLVLADVEELRGNIETAQALRESSLDKSAVEGVRGLIKSNAQELGVDEGVIADNLGRSDYRLMQLLVQAKDSNDPALSYLKKTANEINPTLFRQLEVMFNVTDDEGSGAAALAAARGEVGSLSDFNSTGFTPSYEEGIEDGDSAAELEASLQPGGDSNRYIDNQ